MRKRARIIVCTACYVFLGAATSYGVAWAIAARGEDPFRGRERFWMAMAGEDMVYISEHFSFGRVSRWGNLNSARADPADDDRQATIDQWRSIVQTTREAGNRPSWPEWGAGPTVARWNVSQFATGWPCYAVWYERVVHPGSINGTGGEVRGGYELSHLIQPAGVAGKPRVLPLRPIWIGLILNTIAYGSVYLLLASSVGWLRRACRRRAVRCVHCAYDLKGLQGSRCPECGSLAPGAINGGMGRT